MGCGWKVLFIMKWYEMIFWWFIMIWWNDILDEMIFWNDIWWNDILDWSVCSPDINPNVNLLGLFACLKCNDVKTNELEIDITVNMLFSRSCKHATGMDPRFEAGWKQFIILLRRHFNTKLDDSTKWYEMLYFAHNQFVRI